jgi:hypothetical protein
VNIPCRVGSAIGAGRGTPTDSATGAKMRSKPKQKFYRLTLEFVGGITRTVKAKGSDRETAERRALKHNPSAIGVKRNA